jgi:hypothetical protein
MIGAYGWSLWVMVVGIAATLALGVHALARPTRSTPRGAALAGLAVVVVVCFLWSLKAFNGWPDAFFVLPAAAAGIGGLVPLLARWVPRRALTATVVAWALVATSLSAVAALGNKNEDLDEQRRDVELVMSLLPADADIVSVEAPQPLVLTGQRNASRLQLFGNGLIDYVEDTWPGGIEGYARWLGRRSPTVIAVGGHSTVQVPSWLEPLLRRDYQQVGATLGPFEWFVSTRVPRETRDELEAMLRER